MEEYSIIKHSIYHKFGYIPLILTKILEYIYDKTFKRYGEWTNKKCFLKKNMRFWVDKRSVIYLNYFRPLYQIRFTMKKCDGIKMFRNLHEYKNDENSSVMFYKKTKITKEFGPNVLIRKCYTRKKNNISFIQYLYSNIDNICNESDYFNIIFVLHQNEKLKFNFRKCLEIKDSFPDDINYYSLIY